MATQTRQNIEREKSNVAIAEPLCGRRYRIGICNWYGDLYEAPAFKNKPTRTRNLKIESMTLNETYLNGGRVKLNRFWQIPEEYYSLVQGLGEIKPYGQGNKTLVRLTVLENEDFPVVFTSLEAGLCPRRTFNPICEDDRENTCGECCVRKFQVKPRTLLGLSKEDYDLFLQIEEKRNYQGNENGHPYYQMKNKLENVKIDAERGIRGRGRGSSQYLGPPIVFIDGQKVVPAVYELGSVELLGQKKSWRFWEK